MEEATIRMVEGLKVFHFGGTVISFWWHSCASWMAQLFQHVGTWKRLKCYQEIKGTAEIVTAELRLIERFFLPVKRLLKEGIGE